MSIIKPWQVKIENANRYYKQWEARFKCTVLEDYFEGYQWKQIIDLPFYKPYVVNLIKAEIKKKLANAIHQKIKYEFTPTPTAFEWNPASAMQSAQIKEDVVNTLKDNPDVHFKQNIKLVLRDSYFRFGVMEVGYAADWRNPNYKAPLTSAHDDPSVTIEKAKVEETFEIPEKERVYFKRIKPSRFRVSVSDSPFLNNCAWCGYYSYFYKATLLKTKGFKLPEELKSKLTSTEFANLAAYERMSGASSDSKDMLAALASGEVLKVWTIWDNEANKLLLIDDISKEICFEKDIERINLVTHVHDERMDGFYPIPPVYDWISPQDEINQAREQMRNYRRRFTRKFEYYNVEIDEIDKFKTEEDGIAIKLKSPGSFIRKIDNPDIGLSITEGLTAGRDDFNIVSDSSSDLNTVQRDRTTATQSKITAAKAEVGEKYEQLNFDEFYINVAREALIVVRENFSMPLMAKGGMNDIPFLGAVQPQAAPAYALIYPHQLNDGYDCEIEYTVTDTSPIRMEEELAKMTKFLSMLNAFPQLMLSPTAIMETAYRCGYRNKKVIAEIQRAALLMAMGQASGAQGQDQGAQGMNGNNVAKNNMVGNANPPEQETIDAQLLS